ncbi:unnamed protein product [Oppiella nova]|uniref:Uncharacterized protein n=1 Tax=Oppiella nova TaxID=334625 RepID=A0A7R9MKD1_9ACAR|nr:unnamed protein product [Oppiella nova]CAG2178535.1 unnamed protein product [Oppiella nova]
MAKVAAKAESDFRNNLKRVQSQKFTMQDDEKQLTTKTQPEWATKKAEARPDWALGKKGHEKPETETEEIEIED